MSWTDTFTAVFAAMVASSMVGSAIVFGLNKFFVARLKRRTTTKLEDVVAKLRARQDEAERSNMEAALGDPGDA